MSPNLSTLLLPHPDFAKSPHSLRRLLRFSSGDFDSSAATTQLFSDDSENTPLQYHTRRRYGSLPSQSPSQAENLKGLCRPCAPLPPSLVCTDSSNSRARRPPSAAMRSGGLTPVPEALPTQFVVNLAGTEAQARRHVGIQATQVPHQRRQQTTRRQASLPEPDAAKTSQPPVGPRGPAAQRHADTQAHLVSWIQPFI